MITSAAGQPVTSPSGLQTALEQHHPGDRVTITWTDQTGQSHSASVQLTTGPAAYPPVTGPAAWPAAQRSA